MNWIYPEQLILELKKKTKFIYILFGNDFYLIQDCHINILNTIKEQSLSIDHFRIGSSVCFDWDKVFQLCQTTHLFSTQQILSLQFPKNYPSTYFDKNIPSLISTLTYNKLLFILLIHTSLPMTQYQTWIKLFDKTGILVNCNTLEYTRLEKWVKKQSQLMNLTLENLACQLLCYYYEGNIILLQQILQHLSLIYPDKKISFDRLKNIITDSACFNVNHWIESILLGKKKRANRILEQLKYTNDNLQTLLYKIQREMLVIIQIKYNIIFHGKMLYTLFKKYNVYTQYRRMLLSQVIRRLNLTQLNKILELLVLMELQYHKNHVYLSSSNFELLTEMLCCNCYDNK
ncbi:DNA polymerase III, delta subunit [Candidatus Blochmanniella floridana]|uniref:DNA polymerase III subunit delta n=1 Tax=Blochmanniella floridana TaxID=203907 RepID=Q7VRA8_BLOFL|nr:DNA polymerase III, delta subunit [Candidatus Blochmannia floridanus]